MRFSLTIRTCVCNKIVLSQRYAILKKGEDVFCGASAIATEKKISQGVKVHNIDVEARISSTLMQESCEYSITKIS